MKKTLFLFLFLIKIIFSYQYLANSNYIKSINNNINHDDNYLNINPNLRNIKKCNICNIKVNIKECIPINCTIPNGCPFNRKNK